MAKYVSSSPTPSAAAPDAGASTWKPSEGMVFTTVRLRQTLEADVVVEHEADLSDDDLKARAKAALPQLSDRAEWWCPESEQTVVVTIFPDNADPEGEGEPVTREPFELLAVEDTPDPEVIRE
jgi:hypothetical protein